MADTEEDPGREWYGHKSSLMDGMLGPEHNVVMHALIPYAIGGALDLYYYPNGLPGTAIATKELSESPGTGSSNRVYSCYELVMFTRHPLDLDVADDEQTPFGQMHKSISAVLNRVARYSAGATLNPKDTSEFPADMPRVGGRCLIFDGYGSSPSDRVKDFGLLAVIEVFRSEMEYARSNGGAQLIERLKEKGVYPYSDMDRDPVA